jgi:hypothetical protein
MVKEVILSYDVADIRKYVKTIHGDIIMDEIRCAHKRGEFTDWFGNDFTKEFNKFLSGIELSSNIDTLTDYEMLVDMYREQIRVDIVQLLGPGTAVSSSDASSAPEYVMNKIITVKVVILSNGCLNWGKLHLYGEYIYWRKN